MNTENKSIADSVAALSVGVRNKMIVSAFDHVALSTAAAARHDFTEAAAHGTAAGLAFAAVAALANAKAAVLAAQGAEK